MGLALAPVLSGALVIFLGAAAGTVATSAVVVLLAGLAASIGGKTGELLGIIIANALAWENPLPDIEAFFKDLSLALGAIDPLILDLNGDGIHTTGVDQSTAHFDFTGEGHRTHTGWITTGDGFLVLDRDSNGAIDTGHELFSNFTKLANGTLAANGFQALREFDSNKDGVIDANDAIWSSLKIWRDRNGDGATQQGELLSLTELGILSINLSKEESFRLLDNGNLVRGEGSFVQLVDGKEVVREIQEIWFGQDTLHQKFTTTIALRDDVVALPFVLGAGNVRDLWQAASMDTAEGAALREVLRQVAAAPTTAAQHALIEPLLKAWVATSGMTTTELLAAQGKRWITVMDSRIWLGRLAVLEKMAGTMLNAGGGNGLGAVVLQGARGEQVSAAWDTLVHTVYTIIAAQTTWKPYLDAINYTVDSKDPAGQLRTDFSAMVALLQAAQSRVGTVEVAVLMTELIHQYGADWRVTGFFLERELQRYVSVNDSPALRDALKAIGVYYGAGEVEGSSGADILLAQAGTRELIGAAGNDVLLGTSGNEILYGGTGSDTYFFGRHSGDDTICDGYDFYDDDRDVLVLDAGVLPEDVSVKRDGRSDDLLVTIKGATNVLRIKDQLRQSGTTFIRAIEQFRFANGTTWSKHEIALMTLKSTSGDDVIQGFEGDDLIDGGAGDDKLYGDKGSDTYLFGRNSGNDTIYESSDFNNKDIDTVKFDADVRPEDVMVKRDGRSDDLLVTIKGATNVLRIKDQLRQHEKNFFAAIERFQFANGTIWSKNEVALMTLRSTPGDDVIQGFEGDDLIDGGAGDDKLYGDKGSDTYLFGRNSGNDTIYESYDFNNKDIDTVKFDADVRPEDVMVKRDGRSDDLLVTIKGATNVLRIKDQLRQHEKNFFAAIERFQFANGTTWSKDEVALMTLKSTPGDDLLIGFNGDDILDGGSGTNTLAGGAGNDTYLHGRRSGHNTIEEGYDLDKRYIDVVRFDADIRPQDLTVSRELYTSNIVIKIDGSHTELRIIDQLVQHNDEYVKGIEQFVFADGTVWDKQTIAEKSARTPQIRSLMGWAAGENAHLHDPIGHMWKKYYAAGGKRAGEESFYADGTAPLPWSSRKSPGIAGNRLANPAVISPAMTEIERQDEAFYQAMISGYAKSSATTTQSQSNRDSGLFAQPLIAVNV
ncbi:calcium-binding protein [Paraburkholderia bonniea]|uniref:calcium-binding protein n=1 Tax=Paraburkholderia bonniea TaxID=2152891 RepID=UPI002573E411|nr:calcium-binding protein [Paraburkholderia bonniea]WJF89257.1 calcium-binding protein [Paraburkholderia bonniea]WJF92573.1 calcium-binding protein [Paraburkholderia bonniea]